MNQSNVAQRISNYLQENCISESSLSRMSGISTKRLKTILTSGKPIRFIELEKIINALNVDPNKFLIARKPVGKSVEETNSIDMAGQEVISL